MCALVLMAWYSGELVAVPDGSMTSGLPPWQSAHPSFTVVLVCMLALSVDEWHEMQPELLASASAWVWPAKLGKTIFEPWDSASLDSALVSGRDESSRTPERLIKGREIKKRFVPTGFIRVAAPRL